MRQTAKQHIIEAWSAIGGAWPNLHRLSPSTPVREPCTHCPSSFRLFDEVRRLAWVALLGLALRATAVSAQVSNCRFVLGFADLATQLPEVGQCASDQRYEYTWASGSWVVNDAVQDTTPPDGQRGLLIWRNADNWTAFTEDQRIWINGPHGIEERLTTDPLFPWEDPSPPPVDPNGNVVERCVPAGWVSDWTFCIYGDGSSKVWDTAGHLMAAARNSEAPLQLTDQGQAELDNESPAASPPPTPQTDQE